eukprot:SRR837773.26613.p1 GENE.SRR837773.26613~~SRR837773.26613.p1  ORF type:complete len:164 (+),score=30.77 SRR837773.26613:49-492(+)
MVSAVSWMLCVLSLGVNAALGSTIAHTSTNSTAQTKAATHGGACGFDIFKGLTSTSTFSDAKKTFFDHCMTGVNKHPEKLCSSGSDELFSGYDLAARFDAQPGDAFCKMTGDILEAHRVWSSHHAMMFLRLRASGTRSTLDATTTIK